MSWTVVHEVDQRLREKFKSGIESARNSGRTTELCPKAIETKEKAAVRIFQGSEHLRRLNAIVQSTGGLPGSGKGRSEFLRKQVIMPEAVDVPSDQDHAVAGVFGCHAG